MVLPAVAAAAPVIAKAAPMIMKALPFLADFGGKFLGNKNQQDQRNAQSEALQNYLNSLNTQRDKAKNYMTENYEKGEEQFFDEANKPLQELEQQYSDIEQQNTEQQQNAAKQMQSQLAQQGVRGGQASTLLNRGTGQLAREGIRDINQLKTQEAMGRQQARLGYTSKKGLIPYNTLNTAEWLHMPSDTEKQLMTQAINTKFR